jgi:hypothetical protein
MIRDISNRLLRDFAACLQSRLEAESTAPAGAGASAAEAGGGAATGPAAPATAAAGAAGSAAPAAENGIPDHVQAVSARPRPAQPPATAPPIKGFSLIWSVFLDRIKGLFRRKPM